MQLYYRVCDVVYGDDTPIYCSVIIIVYGLVITLLPKKTHISYEQVNLFSCNIFNAKIVITNVNDERVLLSMFNIHSGILV